mmetsp:Transcript_17604/g.48306  ORF Transcript_17604/g.48306 Transcript_17604/m.48306 type:complete len:794 (+) Transcript_17604:102-2483(+)|eukprot:CAMPEP_0117525326 /NCGR_PEP_ID=MMETSP0784-20121206/35711_1 /TAXON_ID=39447 /ORGANISM="" /LENGTH=793 /DNA_ID=CAMNT_0005321517 /DNA_START=98 /DNA_END=2479 /DNA_ORIENTATION=+
MPAPWGIDRPEFPARVPDPPLRIEDRAITLRQLRELSEFLQRLCKAGLLKYPRSDFNERLARVGQCIKWSQISMHEVTSEVIKKVIPETSSCSWVELVSHGRKQTRAYFCSHNWSESFRDFMATIAHHSREYKVRPDETYWICVFANNQWKMELGATLKQSPFFEALRDSRMTVVMMDKASEVLRRLWCVFEMHETDKLAQAFEFWTPLGRVGSALVSSGPALRALENMDVRAAQATNDVDQRQIRNHIAGASELSGIAVLKDGQKRLDPDAGPCYEQKMIQSHEAKFIDLNKAIQKASMCSIIAQPSKRPFLPSWDAAGDVIELREQISPTLIEDAAERGVSLGQLRAFAETVRGTVTAQKLCQKTASSQSTVTRITWDNPRDTPFETQVNLYHINVHFIQPMTKIPGCAYVELVAEGPQPCEIFVSHWWGTEFKSTMEALEWHAEARCLPDTAIYWMCAFSNRQRALDEVFSDPRKTPFNRALHQSSGVVAIFENRATAGLTVLYNRVWCIFEAWAATSSGKSYDLLMASGALATTRPFIDGGWEFGAFSASAASHVLEFRAEHGTASCEADRTKILNLMARQNVDDQPPGTHPAYDRLSNRMRERVAGPVLREAAREGDISRMREVMEKCPGLLLSSDALRGSLGETPVHIAAAAGQLRAVTLLLEHRASANAQDFAGESPLHYAALAGQAVAIWELYRSNADVDLASFAGETPLDIAWQNPAYFRGIDACAAANALTAAFEDGGQIARLEYDGRRGEDVFMREYIERRRREQEAAGSVSRLSDTAQRSL